MVGWIPAIFLERYHKPRRVRGVETYVSISDYGRDARTSLFGELSWKAGECIRVCKWYDVSKGKGLGVNLVSMETGKFYAGSNVLKEIKC